MAAVHVRFTVNVLESASVMALALPTVPSRTGKGEDGSVLRSCHEPVYGPLSTWRRSRK